MVTYNNILIPMLYMIGLLEAFKPLILNIVVI